MIKAMLLALHLGTLALGQAATESCLSSDQENGANENLTGFYYTLFSGVLVPIPEYLVVIPRAPGDGEFSLAFMRHYETPVRAEDEVSKSKGSLGVSIIWMSKGDAGLEKDRYQFENEEQCEINGISVSHLKNSHAEVRIDELIYVDAPTGEKLLIGGSNLSRYKLLLIKALSRK